MTEALGIHDHPTRKLGRQPENPDKPRLKLSQILKAVPPVPPAEDYTAIDDWDIFANDTYGDCGPCAVAHSRMQVTQYLVGRMEKPVLDDVLDLYKRSGNPGFPSQDDGVILQDMLNEVRKNGIGGNRIVAFARVDHTNEQEMDAANAIFGGMIQGVTLENAQQTQTDSGLWDYARSSTWGGHAIYTAGYTAPRRRTVTWGEEVEYTDAFAAHQLDEAWVVIWPEHLGSRAFLEGIDLNALRSAYSSLTGQELPVPGPLDPPPTPAPQPPPVPSPPSSAPSLDQVAAQLAESLTKITGEPAHHVRTTNRHGKPYESFYISGGFEFGVMDKRG